MTETASEHAHDKFGLDRLVFFSDAVIAIAITLLVLDLKAPELERGADNTALLSALWAQGPKFVGFVTSFWVIGIYWAAHHRLFRNITRYDEKLIHINLLFLMCMAFVPYPTALLFAFPGRLAAVELYAGTMVAIGLTMLAMTYYAGRDHRLVGPEFTWVRARAVMRRQAVVPGVFLFSMVLAPVNPDGAMWSWALLLIVYIARSFLPSPADEEE